MNESHASVITTLKAKYAEATVIAGRLGLSFRKDPGFYLVDVGTREGAALLERQIHDLYRRVAEKIVDVAECVEPSYARIDMVYDAENEVFRSQVLKSLSENQWDLVAYSCKLILQLDDIKK